MAAKSKVKNFQNRKYLSLAVFLVVFAGIGAYLLVVSHAATTTPPLHVWLSGSANAKANDPTLPIVQDTPYYADGPVNVAQMAVGKKAKFNPNRGGYDPGYSVLYQTCYTLRAIGNSPVQTVLTSGATREYVTINPSNVYNRVCVLATVGTSYPAYSVANTAGGTLNVYQVSYEYKPGTATK